MRDKVYFPETIENYPMEEGIEVPQSKAGGGAQVGTAPREVIIQPRFPVKRFSEEILSKSLNTKSKKILGAYTFGVMGAISVGVYENGVSGDIRISPDGIVGRNVNGITTFSIDGTTGDAVFLGTIQAGAVVAGQVTVTGSFVVNDGTYNVIWLGYLAGGF